jgi:hypothetical protein
MRLMMNDVVMPSSLLELRVYTKNHPGWDNGSICGRPEERDYQQDDHSLRFHDTSFPKSALQVCDVSHRRWPATQDVRSDCGLSLQ